MQRVAPVQQDEGGLQQVVAVGAAAGDVQRGGTMVVIDGPRFSTRAESQWYAAQGGSLINMTGAPEAAQPEPVELVPGGSS